MGDVDGFGPYTECGQALACSYDGERGEFLHAMYLDNFAATFAGPRAERLPEGVRLPRAAGRAGRADRDPRPRLAARRHRHDGLQERAARSRRGPATRSACPPGRCGVGTAGPSPRPAHPDHRPHREAGLDRARPAAALRPRHGAAGRPARARGRLGLARAHRPDARPVHHGVRLPRRDHREDHRDRRRHHRRLLDRAARRRRPRRRRHRPAARPRRRPSPTASAPSPRPSAPIPTRSSRASAASPTSRPPWRDADVVQEQGPEDLELKRSLFARIGAAAPAGGAAAELDLGPAAHRHRRGTSTRPSPPVCSWPTRSTRRTCCRWSRSSPASARPPTPSSAPATSCAASGKDPVVLHREVSGFVANRLQSALFREAVHLVARPGSSPPTSSTASSPARSAPAGPPAARSVASTWAAARAGCATCSPTSAPGWRVAGTTCDPTLDDETVEALVTGTEAAYGTESYAALTEARDRAEVAVLAARNTDPTPEESR